MGEIVPEDMHMPLDNACHTLVIHMHRAYDHGIQSVYPNYRNMRQPLSVT
jgi:hypothetical protein